MSHPFDDLSLNLSIKLLLRFLYSKTQTKFNFMHFVLLFIDFYI